MSEMDVDTYWQRMHETSAATGALMCTWSCDVPFVLNRCKKPLLRASLVRSAFEAAGGEDWRTIVPLCAIVEIVMSCLYLTNEVLDHKGGDINVDVHKHDERLLREQILQRVVREYGSQECEQFEHAIRNTYRGLALDIKRLTWKQLDRPIEQLEAWYMQRCRLLNSDLIATGCELAVRLAHGTDEVAAAVWEFGQHFGTGLQMTNDVGDFASVKPDTWADLRNGRLTAPIFYGWHGSSDCRDAIITCRDHYTTGAAQHLTELLETEGHFGLVQALARRQGKLAQSVLRSALTKSNRSALASACVLLWHNRLYKNLT